MPASCSTTATRCLPRAAGDLGEKGPEHLRRVVPARTALLVVADAHEPRVLERVEPAERHVRGASARRAPGIVDR